MDKLTTFTTYSKDHKVVYVETQQVKEGVECDIYTFEDDDTQDLAIVRVQQGFKTPLQRVLKGSKTTEGLFKGKGLLTVRSEDGSIETYELDEQSQNKEVVVNVGQVMQWTAPDDTNLVFYEICDPPYQDGRFENLPDSEVQTARTHSEVMKATGYSPLK